MATAKHVVKLCDMPPDMEQDAVSTSLDAMGRFDTEKEVAQYVRKRFVDKYKGVWHCIIGRNFGSFVTHEAHHHIYFYSGQTAVLLFKTG
ncbi:hypothetical protein EMIHUDRAFT_75572 [Emiliania huxleyi CCMP1516]|uniref:Dynein light chain n=2 Tax=Emiliania huxleyi TaxID=2903 RepID=A0A0D3J698_EMIH1|nr:hypothetical protein EMIHUDRAFT_75572 [Emiliania huxleyi CCMP1516]EOD19033.1 hypothetical protein EMIHUDRAFT_75572 [Emiliania huxleyi CCMP1516]|mmetsp:Transcript_5297/g.15473  ORF Transcript_5297/g.15473 Transcript_5297/m.15473 type:complete len:90 (-) Transcript_5297:173-442(-)|eukprot:CAMPEP_0196680772 /NCGR_PEP_ID=MMETSP1090-20130531/8029_1 /TAXON_ID=37098 /ORGANISM="Isochrysis sp, Strain CCMP1244" /LENGTH=89 /DNA_ID=CAMNT_0042019093 /DNA_START=128 /DNA_END=397 /DNA_ORIENTATION=-